MPRSLPVVSDDADPVWFEQGLKFGCTQCGNCCTGGPGYVWLSDEEVDKLASHLKLTREQTILRYCRTVNGRLSLKELKDHRGEHPCVFLREHPDGRRNCGVYEVRPLQCRTWPFWDGNLATVGAWKRAGHKCPGMDKGKHYSLEQIVARRDATDWSQT